MAESITEFNNMLDEMEVKNGHASIDFEGKIIEGQGPITEREAAYYQVRGYKTQEEIDQNWKNKKRHISPRSAFTWMLLVEEMTPEDISSSTTVPLDRVNEHIKLYEESNRYIAEDEFPDIWTDREPAIDATRALIKKYLEHIGFSEHNVPDTLDVACGKCYLNKIVPKYMQDRIWGIDIDEQVINEANTIYPGRYINGQMNAIPFGENKFGLVAGINALDTVYDLHPALSDIHRVLENDGYCIFFRDSIIDWKLFRREDEQSDFYAIPAFLGAGPDGTDPDISRKDMNWDNYHLQGEHSYPSNICRIPKAVVKSEEAERIVRILRYYPVRGKEGRDYFLRLINLIGGIGKCKVLSLLEYDKETVEKAMAETGFTDIDYKWIEQRFFVGKRRFVQRLGEKPRGYFFFNGEISYNDPPLEKLKEGVYPIFNLREDQSLQHTGLHVLIGRKTLEKVKIEEDFWGKELDFVEDPEREKKFEELRQQVISEQKFEVKQRLLNNPKPTPEEIAMGVYAEAIERQCRQAMFEMRRKGYDTYSSGFGTRGRQVVDGINFFLSPDTINLLGENSFYVKHGGTTIGFFPDTPDLEEIIQKWNQLVDLLPDLGNPAKPQTFNEDEFKERFKRENPQYF